MADLLDEGVPHMPVQGSVHNVQRAPHQTLGTRTRRRGRADAARSEPASHACAPRNRRASVRHAEDADGCDTLSNQAVAQCRDRNGAERTRLQPHTRSKHRRHQAAPGGNPGLKSLCRHAERVTVQVGRRGPRLTPDPIQKKYAQTVVATRIVSGYVQFFGEGKTFLHSLDPQRTFGRHPPRSGKVLEIAICFFPNDRNEVYTFVLMIASLAQCWWSTLKRTRRGGVVDELPVILVIEDDYSIQAVV